MSSRSLRVAQFTTQYPYPTQFDGGDEYFCSGAERVVQELSEGLARKGHDVHVFTSSRTRQYERTRQNGVTVHRSPSLTSVNTTQIAPSIIIDHVSESFDVVHAHNSTPPGMLAAYCNARVHDTPLVVTHHGGEQYEQHGSLLRRGGLFLYTRALIDVVFKYAERVVTPSAGYVSESRALSLPGVTVETIPNGVDFDEFDITAGPADAKASLSLPADSVMILYLGSHHSRKGVDVLLQAFAAFAQERPQAHLVLAGSGELTEQLKQEATSLGIRDQVTFPGYVPESEKSTYMTAADLFVLPSKTAGAEMFPLVILEASAAGTPVVTSDFPTLRSIVTPHDVGCLVEPDDSEALTKTLTELVEGGNLEQYRENARKMASEHQWENIVEQYQALYRRILE